MQKENDARHDTGHDRGCMRTQCVKGQHHTNNLRKNDNINVAEIMYKLVSQQFASEIDIDVFGENLLKLHYFIAAFNKAVKKKTEDPCGKQTQPIKYTTGEEKEIVKKCIKLPLKERYKTAKQMMYQL